MVGVPRFGGKVGQLAARNGPAERRGGLREGEVTLEAQGSLRPFGRKPTVPRKRRRS
jgi:hypothetical protein